MRNRSIDTMRGILTIAMIYGHVLQFFGNAGVYPGMEGVILVINLLCFPGFLFCFGRTITLAYLGKEWKAALPRMIKTFFRLLAAFWLSGIGYRVLRENKPFGRGIVEPILMLLDIPGWSEFLVTFALMMGLVILLFPLFRWIGKRSFAAFAASVLLTLSSLLPYDSIRSVHAQLLVGGRGFACFPVLQYLPYLLMGMSYQQASRKQHALLAIPAACVSLTGILHAAAQGIPERFPPHMAWLAIPWAGIALILLLSQGLHQIPGIPWRGGCCHPWTTCLGAIGGKSLYLLLGSNLVLFTFSGKGLLPLLSPKAGWPWNLPIQSLWGSISWTALLLLVLMETAWMAGRGTSAVKRDITPGNSQPAP